MTQVGRKIALAAVGGSLAIFFAAFAVLLTRYDRGDDANNEDALLACAKKAEVDDDPPLAAECWHRLAALNPFVGEYADRYCHALVRMRDFHGLSAYTNGRPVRVELTAGENAVEELLARGMALEAASSNDLAVACYAKATNLNYYAAAPLLIDTEIRVGRFGDAIDAARAYIRRFPSPAMALHTAEWCALASRPDLVEETRSALPPESGYRGILFGYYCDALVAWVKGDGPALASALKNIGMDAFDTPVARLMALESAADGDSPTLVAVAYGKLMESPDVFDFRARGRAAVKRFVAAHFPQGLPMGELGRLADMVNGEGRQDVELLRVSLLAQLEGGSLGEDALAGAERLYPKDAGLRKIREYYERVKAESL